MFSPIRRIRIWAIQRRSRSLSTQTFFVALAFLGILHLILLLAAGLFYLLLMG